jgi:6-phosphogluconate dehydrogenase
MELVMGNDIGLIGLAVMGQNLARNLARNGYQVSIYNRSKEKTEDFFKDFSKNFTPTYTLEELVGSLSQPRKIFMMVKAGDAVDKTIDQLIPHLDKGDIVIDGGNSYFEDTNRRELKLKEKGINYLGCGVSGGEEGALNGPSLMPGGVKESYLEVKDMLTAISAKAPDPCVTYIGPGGSGHFVKMVHNGIEYGDMQLIAEAYSILKEHLKFSNSESAEIFGDWNKVELNSFLIEVTAKVIKKQEADGGFLVDRILDKAGQKGTGKWTSISAMDFGVALGTITSSVDSRFVSSQKSLRGKLSETFPKEISAFSGDRAKYIVAVKDALFASKVISYTQGLAILCEASDKFDWNLNLGEIARIWRGGCIIRAQFLDDIARSYEEIPELESLLLSDYFSNELKNRLKNFRSVVASSIECGLPVMAMASSLTYFDSITKDRLPANIIQAQRDFFGAHTFERVDKPGVFHDKWEV